MNISANTPPPEKPVPERQSGQSGMNWICKEPDPKKVLDISFALGVSEVMGKLLVNRGIQNVREADLFLHPELSKLHNCFLLPDMEKAVNRVRQAMDAKEKILVYGDRDVDGVTSTAILVRTLKTLGAEVDWALPEGEGHGLHRSILERYKDQKFKLLITADCGTSATEEIEFANSLGMDVIVTDHHLPPEALPPAYAIVNPNLKTSAYPFNDLAGCMVAFKFAYAVMFTFNRNYNDEYVVLDLETTGLSSSQDDIIEIGAVCIRNFVPISKFHSLVRPTVPISSQAMAVHGITESMVSDAPLLKDVFPELVKFIGDRIIVAHNARFDLSFMQDAMRKILGAQLTNPIVDTLAISRDLLPDRSHALTSLANDLKIDLPQAHRAMDDTVATVSLFQKLEELLDPRLKFFLDDQLDLVTLGTIADMAPLVNENRIIVKLGLSHLLETNKIGLKKLIEKSHIRNYGDFSQDAKSRLDRDPLGQTADAHSNAGRRGPSPQEVSRWITPLINAAGRLSHADVAAKLLLTENETEASRLTEEIVLLNEERRTLQKVNLKKFFQLAEDQCNLENDSVLIVVADGLEHGVTGIVASRMVSEYQKPVILLIAENGLAMGSARSMPGFNIVNSLDQCRELLRKYGGHPQAAGLNLHLEHLEEFKERLKKIVAAEMKKDPFSPKIEIDMELQFQSIDDNLLRELSNLTPFGKGNPPPTFLAKGVQITGWSYANARGTRLQFTLMQDGKTLQAVSSGTDNRKFEYQHGGLLDVVFQAVPNQNAESRTVPHSGTGARGNSEPMKFVVLDIVRRGAI